MSEADLSRRAFLRATARGVAAAQLLRPALARAIATPAANATGTIMDVEHVVIFMQENRSFDHYFGTMAGVRGFADPDPVILPGGGPVWRQPDGKGGFVAPFAIDVAASNFSVMKSLDHHWSTGHAAWNGGRYDNWLPAKGALTMGHLARADIPYHFALADAFTVCDAYHASLQGPTCPNRLYLMTGSVDHHSRGGHGPVIDNIDITQVANGVVFGRDWRTYAERLEEAGIGWQLYRQGDNQASDDDSDGGMNTLMAFEAFRAAQPGDRLHRRGVQPRRLEQLKRDVLEGRLAQVSWIVPPRIFCEHPRWPPAYGVEYFARILDALTADPAVWSKTALLIMYDENDGFFDHVVPPTPPFARGDGLSTVATHDERHPETGEPYGLGMRVPMLVVSPWSRGGWVCSQTFDHTSVLRFLETRFGVHAPDISPWRRTVCGDLTAAFDFATPNAAPPRELATISAAAPLPDQAQFNLYRAVVAKRPKPAIPPEQPHPMVEPGHKQARPLPYDLAVDVEARTGGARLRFVNRGKAGAAFMVVDRLRPDLAPRRYTVGAGKRIADEWTFVEGHYSLAIHGPAGFHRTFEGGSGEKLRAELRHEPDGTAALHLRNAGPDELVVVVRDDHRDQAGSHRIAAHDRVILPLDLSSSGHWYRLAIEAGDTRQRFAGHVETGAPSISDPAMARSA